MDTFILAYFEVHIFPAPRLGRTVLWSDLVLFSVPRPPSHPDPPQFRLFSGFVEIWWAVRFASAGGGWMMDHAGMVWMVPKKYRAAT